ncbi:hypothetical protein BsIDN1_59270 [Bacillus safensis]|uniref:Uncharacterized protein n=1 Tax=Bacillus safensis TaxID=561879 RepID=A0A5S9MKC0_BACIA|nr:hypothetical protein BsIDN1_59270 [Bacillus safensis]
MEGENLMNKKNNRSKISKLFIGLLTIIISTTFFFQCKLCGSEKNQMIATLKKINHFILKKKDVKKTKVSMKRHKENRVISIFI